MQFRAAVIVATFTLGGLALVTTRTQSADPVKQSSTPSQEPVQNSASAAEKLSLPETRRQARLLQDTYEATLHVMHRRYFDADEKDVIPARALEDVFALVDEETAGTTRWIAVNTPAMNVDHEPKTDFEKEAAKALAEGNREHEQVIDGMYHRAGAVTLFGSCLKCHLSGLTKQVQKERVAALVVRLPVQEE